MSSWYGSRSTSAARADSPLVSTLLLVHRDHRLQQAGRGGVRLQVVRLREEEALQPALRVVGEVERLGVLRRRLQVLELQRGLVRDQLQGGRDAEPLRDRHPGQHPGARVEDQRERGDAAHLLAQPVGPRLDGHRARVVLGRVAERILALHHARGDQGGGDVGGGVAGLDPDQHVPGALAGVVRRGAEAAEQRPAAVQRADAGGAQHQQHDQRDDQPPAAAPAPVRLVPAAVRPAGLRVVLRGEEPEVLRRMAHSALLRPAVTAPSERRPTILEV